MARPVTKPCGTRSAYKRHLMRREQPCAECKKAHNEWHKTYRQNNDTRNA